MPRPISFHSMKKSTVVALALVLALPPRLLRFQPPPHALVLTSPPSWTDALPVGNGRLGAMVFGGAAHERIQFNEDTVWTGEPHDYAHKGAAAIRSPADPRTALGGQAEGGRGPRHEGVHERADTPEGLPGVRRPAARYARTPGMVTGVPPLARSRYRHRLHRVHPGRRHLPPRSLRQLPGQRDRRAPLRQKPGASAFTAALRSAHANSQVSGLHPMELSLRGQVADCAIRFEARLLARPAGRQAGTARRQAGSRPAPIRHPDAGRRHQLQELPRRLGRPGGSATTATLAASAKKSLRRPARRTHRAITRRSSAASRSTWARRPPPQLPTDERIAAFDKGSDPALVALLFQYGRYLMIASSRPGGQPANLQGLWNDSNTPAWDSKYTDNINTEMNYWPAEDDQPLGMPAAAVRRAQGPVAIRRRGRQGALQRRAAGWCTTISTCGAAPPPSTPAITASGRPAAPGSPPTCGSTTSSPATSGSCATPPTR